MCRTSNPGAKEFQDELYLKVAKKVVQEWNQNNNCGLVVGATGMQELQKVREIAPNLPLLIPGVGTQGGLLTEVLRYGKDSSGGGLLINVSRSVIFASSGKNFAGAARQKVLELIQK